MQRCLTRPSAALILSILADSPAFACSCRQFSPRQLIDNAPFIFSGEVVSLQRARTPSPQGYGPDQVTATIRVESRWKRRSSRYGTCPWLG